MMCGMGKFDVGVSREGVETRKCDFIDDDIDVCDVIL